MSDPELEPPDHGLPQQRVRLDIAYDGTEFRGLAPNPGVRTVVGEISDVLADVLGSAPELVMAGRTDAGVHAQGQVLSFDVPNDVDLERLRRSLERRLAPEIVARSLVAAPSDFSARFDAVGRRYRYLVVNRPVPDPFLARYGWHVSDRLDLGAMRLACDPIRGEHDFSSFCRRPRPAAGSPEPSLVRRVDHAAWVDLEDGLLEFRIDGSAFCHQMIRSIVGFHVAIGRGKRSAGEVLDVLRARDRQRAEQPAPAHGLTLVSVDY